MEILNEIAWLLGNIEWNSLTIEYLAEHGNLTMEILKVCFEIENIEKITIWNVRTKNMKTWNVEDRKVQIRNGKINVGAENWNILNAGAENWKILNVGAENWKFWI